MTNDKLADTLRDTFNTTNPVPLASGDARYVDCTAVRGNDDTTLRLFRNITWADMHTAQLFTGHRGCGKSTELLRLKSRLEKADFAVIYFEADDIINLEDLVYSDIMVAIAQQVHNGLVALGVGLGHDLLDDIAEWFAEKVLLYDSVKAAEASISLDAGVGTLPVLSPVAKLMAQVTGQLRTGVESRKQVRQRIDQRVDELLTRVNLLLDRGRIELQKQGKQDLVVIVDNLDRIQFRTIGDDANGRNSHDAIYIDHGEQLCDMHCHMIYTVPIAMFYSPQSSILTGIFPDDLMLSMIKIEERDGTPCIEGLEALRAILAERIDIDKIFTDEALLLLCKMSGGHPRILMTLVREACGYAKNRMPKPIDLNAAERAVINLTRQYSRAVPEEHFPLLAQVAQSKQIRNDNAHRQMLHTLSILEYLNGGEPWHNVHPAVRKLQKLQMLLPKVVGSP